MKKTVLVGILALSVSDVSMAESNFTGFVVGAELSSAKHTFDISGLPSSYSDINAKSSSKTSIGVFGQYGFDFAKDFVGIGEIKLRTGNSESKTERKIGPYTIGTYSIAKEKFNFGLAYLQGYRITDTILPYVKIGAEISSFDLGSEISQYVGGSSLFGVVYGAGVKFNLTENIDAGLEYTQTRLRNIDSDIKAKVNKIAVNVAYRF